MYCKTFRTQLSSEGIVRFTRWVKEKYKPLISVQPGFKSTYFCTNEENNFCMIMLWEEEHNIQDWTDNEDHKAISAEIKDVFINEVKLDFYKVTEEIL